MISAMVVLGCLFLKESNVLTYSVFFLTMAVVCYTHFTEAITHYNKETFLHNKLSVILLAKVEFVTVMNAPIFAGILFVVRFLLFPEVFSNFWHGLIVILTIAFLDIGIFMVSLKVSEHCQKKIVHIENENR